VPTVSVIMPAFNVEPYVGDAIRSALAQTYPDFELIVVDDGSKDGTADVVRSLAREDKRVKLVQQANRGLAGARNSALRASRGEFFALLDSDDLWEPEFLAEQMAILEAHPEVDIVTGNGWCLGGAKHGQLARPYPDPRPAPEYDFWLRAAVAGFTFARNDRPLGHYRIRSDSLSASDVRMIRGILHVYTKLRPVIAERPREMAILERQITRFETEWLAAEARLALEIADFEAAREHLGALHARRGGAALGVARFLARWAPKTLKRMIRVKRATSPTVPAGPTGLPERP
jgi:glycosyltransferase involved in cell wall biosynthesis